MTAGFADTPQSGRFIWWARQDIPSLTAFPLTPGQLCSGEGFVGELWLTLSMEAGREWFAQKTWGLARPAWLGARMSKAGCDPVGWGGLWCQNILIIIFTGAYSPFPPSHSSLISFIRDDSASVYNLERFSYLTEARGADISFHSLVKPKGTSRPNLASVILSCGTLEIWGPKPQQECIHLGGSLVPVLLPQGHVCSLFFMPQSCLMSQLHFPAVGSDSAISQTPSKNSSTLILEFISVVLKKGKQQKTTQWWW